MSPAYIWLLALLFTPSLANAGRNGGLRANMPPLPIMPKVDMPEDGPPVVSRNGTVLPPYNTTFYFDQLIDHNNPGLGTFQQRYWHTWEYYESGGPIIIMTPGETNADGYDGYLTNKTINGLISNQQNGAVVLLEHRFFGLSNPRDDLSEKSLQLLTIEQAIEDFEYFMYNAKLPQPNGDELAPGKAPWILTGGSYAGALTSWTMVNKPGLFQAGYASSGVVETIEYFWQYFDPIRQFMPKNCSADVEVVIAHVDSVFSGHNTAAINALKANWGLQELTHLDDVAGSLRENLWDWQSLQPYLGPGAQFFDFCDALEVKDGVNAGPDGWGLEHALSAWGSYWNSTYLDLICDGLDVVDCLGTYDPTQSYFTDTSIDNAGRSWEWFVCNYVGFLQDGAPTSEPTVVTRLVQPEYDIRQCGYYFPQTFKQPHAAATSTTNSMYHGWNVNVDKLFFANGQRDPWRDATVSSDFHTRQSSNMQPIAVGDGFHCSDLLVEAAEVDPTIQAVQTKALTFMKQWLSEWKPSKSHRRELEMAKRAKPMNAWFRGTFRG